MILAVTLSGSATGVLPASSPLPAVADPEFDQMAVLAQRVLRAPMALVSLVNRDCQIIPGAAGVDAELDSSRTNSLRYSLCQYVVRSAEPFIVDDTAELELLADNLSVTEMKIAAYAGMPLVDRDGIAFGSLCVLDFEPRHWTPDELDTLHALAASCSAQLQLREANARAAVSADRDRIGRELHEGVIRELFGLTMALGHARTQAQGQAKVQLDAAIGTVDEVIAKIRRSVFDIAV